MKRRLLTFLTALSLLVCVAATGVWVASARAAHWIAWRGDASAVVGGVYGGGCFAGRASWVASSRRATGFRYRVYAANELPADFDRLPGYAWSRRLGGFALGFNGDARGSSWMVRVPLWSVVLVSLIAPAAAWRSRRRRLRRVEAKLCPACGYDLRATPGRCPECGHAVGGGQ